MIDERNTLMAVKLAGIATAKSTKEKQPNVLALVGATHCEPTLVKAEDALRMATIGGAELLSMDNEIGFLEIGKKADIIIVDFQNPHLYPKTNIISHLVYSASLLT